MTIMKGKQADVHSDSNKEIFQPPLLSCGIKGWHKKETVFKILKASIQKKTGYITVFVSHTRA